MVKIADAAMEKELPKLLNYVYLSTTPKIVDEVKVFENLPKPVREEEEMEEKEGQFDFKSDLVIVMMMIVN